EPPPLGLVGLGHLGAQGLDARYRQLDELGEQLGVDRLVGHHQHRLDGTSGLVDHDRGLGGLARVLGHPSYTSMASRSAWSCPSVPSQTISISPKVDAWRRSTRPCLNSSSTARNRTTTSRRSTKELVSRRNPMEPTRGSSSTSSSTASATLRRMGATWSSSTLGTGLGAVARR